MSTHNIPIVSLQLSQMYWLWPDLMLSCWQFKNVPHAPQVCSILFNTSEFADSMSSLFSIPQHLRMHALIPVVALMQTIARFISAYLARKWSSDGMGLKYGPWLIMTAPRGRDHKVIAHHQWRPPATIYFHRMRNRAYLNCDMLKEKQYLRNS